MKLVELLALERPNGLAPFFRSLLQSHPSSCTAPSCAPGPPRVIPPRPIASCVVEKNQADGQNMKDTSGEGDKKMKDTSGMEDQSMSPRNEMAANGQ